MEKKHVFSIGDLYHGFMVTNVRDVDELDAVLYQMTFEKTSTELCWFDGGDRNKLFSIAFKTLPEDSTGVFHILEHSVLCGSEKFPVKEPFVDLMKSSQNTFLNAMTFGDKTMYPVSSLNSKDFLNLTEVYLDAVFAPAILKNPNILLQEGWHYKLGENENDVPEYNGVVYNEMKGALSDVDELATSALSSHIFKDNCYGFISGGDPDHIPDLTYEKFVDTYKRFYHPTNARIWLDGEIPVEETFTLIESYLDRFDKNPEVHEIAYQQPVDTQTYSMEYEVNPDEDLTKKTQIYMSKIYSDFDDEKTVSTATILSRYLAGTPESPLRKKLVDRGICQNVKLNVDNGGVFQPTWCVNFENVNPEKVDSACDEFFAVLEEEANLGIDPTEIEAILTSIEFAAKTPGEPAGLERAINSMDTWLYGGDPLTPLVINDVIKFLRQQENTSYFTDVLRKVFIDKTGLVTMVMTPSVTCGEQKRQAEAERLKQKMESWSAEDIAEIKKQNEALLQWQTTPDSPEASATIPHLTKADVNTDVDCYPPQIEKTDNTAFLKCAIPAKGVTYLNMLFPVDGITIDDVPYVAIFTKLLTNLSTEKYTARELQKQIRLNIGSINFSTLPYSKKDDFQNAVLNIQVSMQSLDEKLPEAENILAEIMLHTSFADKSTVLSILRMTLEAYKQLLTSSGMLIGQMRCNSVYSAADTVAEHIIGYSYFKALRNFVDNFDEEYPRFVKLCSKICSTCFTSSSYLIASGTMSGTFDEKALLTHFPSKETEKSEPLHIVPHSKREAIVIPGQVSFACVSSHMNAVRQGHNRGAWALLSSIMSSDYLWSEVRVKGGAYGVSLSNTFNATSSLYSYRDPSPASTLKAYRGMGDYLRSYLEKGGDIDKYVVSYLAESLRTPSQLLEKEMFAFIEELSIEDRRNRRKNVLDVTREDLLSWCDALDDLSKGGSICVVGYKDAIDACSEEGLTILE